MLSRCLLPRLYLRKKMNQDILAQAINLPGASMEKTSSLPNSEKGKTNRKIHPGDPIRICYLPQDPSILSIDWHPKNYS